MIWVQVKLDPSSRQPRHDRCWMTSDTLWMRPVVMKNVGGYRGVGASTARMCDCPRTRRRMSLLQRAGRAVAIACAARGAPEALNSKSSSMDAPSGSRGQRLAPVFEASEGPEVTTTRSSS
jgi:hypothetical protein